MVDVAALEAAAAQRLDPASLDYFRGGAEDELTLADNTAAWGRLRLRPQVLRGVGAVSTGTTVLGSPVASPILVAPTAYHRLANPLGESATAAGAAAAGSIMVLSTFSTQPLEEVAAAAPSATRWFQLYIYRDRAVTAQLAGRAAAAGYRALVLTVDLPVVGNRLRDERNGFALPAPLTLAHAPEPQPDRMQPSAAGSVPGARSQLASLVSGLVDPAITFDDIGWLREVSGLPVVVKGVLRGDDAARCVDAGAAAVAVSNHGGRQLDGALASADALPDVVAAVAGSVEVYVDGGVRRGSDVLRALALGARAVLVGRPVVYGLAVGGADGVRDVLDTLTGELARAMMLCGVPCPADAHRGLLA